MRLSTKIQTIAVRAALALATLAALPACSGAGGADLGAMPAAGNVRCPDGADASGACAPSDECEGGDEACEGGGADAGAAECADGEVRHCSVILGEHNGVVSCFSGEQRCDRGVWSICGEVTT